MVLAAGAVLLGVVSGVPAIVALPAGIWLAGHHLATAAAAMTATAGLLPLVAIRWLPGGREAGRTAASGTPVVIFAGMVLFGAGFGVICVRIGYPAAFALTGASILATVPVALRERKAVASVARPV